MAEDKGTFEVVCPCCEARLKIDTALRQVLSHEAPPRPSNAPDLDQAGRLLAEQKARREAIFAQSQEHEKSKTDLLDRKFQEALEKSKDEPVEKPTRDIDL